MLRIVETHICVSGIIGDNVETQLVRLWRILTLKKIRGYLADQRKDLELHSGRLPADLRRLFRLQLWLPLATIASFGTHHFPPHP